MDKKTEKEVIKCSRCGLCADICPVYSSKHSENALLRGKFLQLLGVIRGDLKFNNSIKKSLNECIGCEKCVSQCPSAINAPEIFEKIRFENLTFLEKILTGKFAFKMKILGLKIFYILKHPEKIFRKKKLKKISNKKFAHLTHFNGCLTKALNTSFSLPFEIKEGDFECCGVPYKGKGNLHEYYKTAAKNIEKIEKTAGLVVFNCATCLSSVRSYKFNDPKTKDRLVFYTDIYKEILKTRKISSKNIVNVTFHMPCHLETAGISLFDIENLLSKIENLNYKPLQNPCACCGFGGDYFTRHPKIAASLATKKAQDVINSKAEILLTACPTCIWGIKYGLKSLYNRKIKVYDLAQYLSTLDFTLK